MGVIPIVANRESWLWAPPPYFQVSSESLALSCSGGAAVRAGGLGLSLGSRRLSPHACGTSGCGRVRASPAPSVAHTRRRHLRAVRIPFLGAFAVRDGRFVVWAQRRRLIAIVPARSLSLPHASRHRILPGPVSAAHARSRLAGRMRSSQLAESGGCGPSALRLDRARSPEPQPDARALPTRLSQQVRGAGPHRRGEARRRRPRGRRRAREEAPGGAASAAQGRLTALGPLGRPRRSARMPGYRGPWAGRVAAFPCRRLAPIRGTAALGFPSRGDGTCVTLPWNRPWSPAYSGVTTGHLPQQCGVNGSRSESV